MKENPEPPLPPEVDLRDFPYMPLHIARLFNSEFHAKANDSEWRAGLTLWLKAFQLPGTGLPDDDVALARLAEYGRDVKAWRKVKAMALRGWEKCSDGRWYHPVVAEVAQQAWLRKVAQRDRTEKARNTRLRQRQSQPLSQTDEPSVTDDVTEPVTESKGREGKGREVVTALSDITPNSDRSDSGGEKSDFGNSRITQRHHGSVNYSDPKNRNAFADKAVADVLASKTNSGAAWLTVFAARDPTDPDHERAKRECEQIARTIPVVWNASDERAA